MARTLVFDPLGTVLDLGALEGEFQRLLGDADAESDWWRSLQRHAAEAARAEAAPSFEALAERALEEVAEQRGCPLTPKDKDTLVAALGRLPAAPDARESLERLRKAGLRLLSLSATDAAQAETQLRRAGLLDAFDGVLAATGARGSLASPAVYREAAESLGLSPADLRLVSAEPAAVRGATSSGCAAALLGREEAGVAGADVTAADLATLAERIVATELGANFPG